MIQQPTKLPNRTRVWALLKALGFTVLIPIEAAVMAFIALLVTKNTSAAAGAFLLFLFLGTLAISIDRTLWQARLKQTLIERDQARAAAEQAQHPAEAKS